MNAFEDHIQWNAVKEVCAKLQRAGFEALLAGGCVRDLILRREPNDFDVATNATPDEVESLFDRSIAVGKQFGVIVLPFGDFHIEVATFREDLEYKDGRRPEGVKFSTAKADAQRRDFTINALFFDTSTGKIIDYVGGQTDIVDGILRTVGDPQARFDEDKLRILRAIRFSAQLDFKIERETLEAIVERAPETNVVSRERIRDEILKLLRSPHRTRGLALLKETGVLAAVLPALSAALDDRKQTWLTSFELLEPSEDVTALLALFLWPHPESARELKLDNAQADALASLFKNLDAVMNPSSLRFGELAFLLTKSFAPSLLMVADTLARSNALPHELNDRGAWNKALTRARPDGHTAVEPLVSGKDLITMGIKPGPQMGELLHEIFLQQLEGALASREAIATYIQNKK